MSSPSFLLLLLAIFLLTTLGAAHNKPLHQRKLLAKTIGHGNAELHYRYSGGQKLDPSNTSVREKLRKGEGDVVADNREGPITEFDGSEPLVKKKSYKDKGDVAASNRFGPITEFGSSKSLVEKSYKDQGDVLASSSFGPITELGRSEPLVKKKSNKHNVVTNNRYSPVFELDPSKPLVKKQSYKNPNTLGRGASAQGTSHSGKSP